MNTKTVPPVYATSFNRAACQTGIVHLGFGAFHRAHQAVYLDDYMDLTGDLRWGIAAVNLRGTETAGFKTAQQDVARNDGYFLKSISPDGDIDVRRVRSHVGFYDWSAGRGGAEALLAQTNVHLVTITVTESGYYTDPAGDLDLSHPVISAEIQGAAPSSVYGYLRAGLTARKLITGAALTIACCDNIRQNGKMLHRNLLSYLIASGDRALADWVAHNVAFPCSMVDRITPRTPPLLAPELSLIYGAMIDAPVMAEDFIQWVLQTSDKTEVPDLAQVGVTVTPDVDPYEETKIRVLNGGHTGLSYLAALKGIETFDAAMRDPELRAHFDAFEREEVLPALTLDLPFSKEGYLEQIAQRFGNVAIGDTVARICADGMAKFPIFIRPTLLGCLEQGITPTLTIRSIASWFVFARHVAAGKIAFEYVEPSWSELEKMLDVEAFAASRQLWGDIPANYPNFAQILRQEISELELKWPI